MERNAAATSGSLRAATMNDRSMRPPRPGKHPREVPHLGRQIFAQTIPVSRSGSSRRNRFAKRLNHHRRFVGPPAVDRGLAGARAFGDGFGRYLRESRLVHQVERRLENPLRAWLRPAAGLFHARDFA